MNTNTVAQAKNKAELILEIVFLMFLLSGCVTQVGSAGKSLKCNVAEEAVNKAQKNYDDATQELAQSGKNENLSNTFPVKMQILQDSQEKAFLACNPAAEAKEETVKATKK